MRQLINWLNRHTELYNNGTPEVSDSEWDKTYFRLQEMEERLGYYYPDSPTNKIHYTEVENLNKVNLEYPMLSLAKTKEIKDIEDFFGNKAYVAMAKMDGLSVSLRYMNGMLVEATTRGNGTVGEDITHNAKVISNVPQEIPIDNLVVHGEIICPIDTFEKSFSDDYRHPRNFASGSIRLLNSKECEARKLKFIAWGSPSLEETKVNFFDVIEQLSYIGFDVVPHSYNTKEGLSLEEITNILKVASSTNQYPIDGLVFKFADNSYGKSLGMTAHHPNSALAFKFYDEEFETTLREIEWSPSRNGTFTPIAIFDEVEIDGTKISRASLSNISVAYDTLGIPHVGQKIWISKRNAIIPKVERAEKQYLGDMSTYVPNECPVCGTDNFKVMESDSGTKILVCGNPHCEAKILNQLKHFCSNKGLDIRGLSEATLSKLLDWGWINTFDDIFNLANYRNEWITKSGFGPKSVDKIIEAIAQSTSNVKLFNFISAFGIPLIGLNVSKELEKHFSSYEDFKKAINEKFDFSELPNFGPEMKNSLLNFDYSEMDKVSYRIKFDNQKTTEQANSTSLNVVITGSLNFGSRDKYKEYLEELGVKVQSSVNSKTNYLIANKKENSSKYKKALELNIPIVTEETLEKLI